MTAGDRAAHVEREAVAALERLADQAWHTAGDTEGRGRVREDRAAVLAALPQTGDAAAALADEFEAEAARYRQAEPVHWRTLAEVTDEHAARLRAALTAGADQ